VHDTGDAADTWDAIERFAARLEAHGRALPVEQRRILQILKITEEAGEVAQAVFGALGQNPRKGRTHTWQDVEAEVCDVIITAMVALARLTPEPREAFARHLEKIIARDLAPPSPPTSG
jgi:NTP pyrophosphatase (non-canonical NTP hydrolase)